MSYSVQQVYLRLGGRRFSIPDRSGHLWRWPSGGRHQRRAGSFTVPPAIWVLLDARPPRQPVL